MTCTESMALMYARPGELTKDQSARLKKHLQTCASCAAEQKKLSRAMRVVGRMRNIFIFPENPEKLTADILNAVNQPRKPAETLVDRFLGTAFNPSVRVGYGLFVTSAVGVFLVQQLMLVQDVESLERRMTTPQRPPSVEVSYSIPADAINHVPGGRELQSYVDGSQSRNGIITVSRESLMRNATTVSTILGQSFGSVSNRATAQSIEKMVAALERSAILKTVIPRKESP